jgi:DNA-binding NtrC family response regulator
VNRKKRILLVDDEESVIFVLKNCLGKREDVEIATANNGREACQAARRAPFDLVITDLRMPVMDGVELTQEFKALYPQTAVIWITAYGAHLREADADRLGVYCCLEKPLQVAVIRKAAQAALDDGRCP